MHKWQPKKYYFAYVLISLTSLVCMDKRKGIKSKEKAVSLNIFNNNLFIHSTQLAARQACITVTWNKTTFRFDLG